MKVLVTGAAGFIGMHVSQILLSRGDEVVGLDNLNDYYDPQLKRDRLARLTGQARGSASSRWTVEDRAGMEQPLRRGEVSTASCTWPLRPACAIRIAEPARLHRQQYRRLHQHPGRLPPHQACSTWPTRPAPACTAAICAMPFSEHHNVDHPDQPVCRHQEGQRADGAHLQPTSTASPRPACASSRSTAPGAGRTWRCSCSPRPSSRGEPIKVFNHGKMIRDFTYIDDIVEGIIRVTGQHPPPPDPEPGTPIKADPGTSSSAPYRLYNIGNQ